MIRNSVATAIIISAFLWLAPPAQSDVIDANWFSNATSISGVVDPPRPNGPERLRLQEGFNAGFVEGAVSLPSSEDWSIEFIVTTDSNFDLPTEFVDIFFDNVFVQRVFNTPLETIYDIRHQITGNQFVYRFEFDSPSTNEGSRLIVGRGTATSVPEPSALVSIGLASLFVLGRRKRHLNRTT